MSDPQSLGRMVRKSDIEIEAIDKYVQSQLSKKLEEAKRNPEGVSELDLGPAEFEEGLENEDPHTVDLERLLNEVDDRAVWPETVGILIVFVLAVIIFCFS